MSQANRWIDRTLTVELCGSEVISVGDPEIVLDPWSPVPVLPGYNVSAVAFTHDSHKLHCAIKLSEPDAPSGSYPDYIDLIVDLATFVVTPKPARMGYGAFTGTAIVFSLDGRYAAIATSGHATNRIVMYDLIHPDTPHTVVLSDNGMHPVYHMEFVSNDVFAYSQQNRHGPRFVSVGDWEHIPPTTEHFGYPHNLRDFSISPNGQFLAVVQPGGINPPCRVHDMNTGSMIFQVAFNGLGIGVKFSPDGQYLAIAWRLLDAPVQLLVLRTSDWSQVTAQGIPTGNVFNNMVFSPDSRYLAAQCGSLVIYDTSSWTVARTIPILSAPLRGHVKFSRDSKFLANRQFVMAVD